MSNEERERGRKKEIVGWCAAGTTGGNYRQTDRHYVVIMG